MHDRTLIDIFGATLTKGPRTMSKIALIALCAGLTGSAITLTSTTIYSSQFQCAFPIGASFKTVLDPANIWSATIIPTAVNQPDQSVLVDIDGDQQMDTVHPGLRVLITDIQNSGQTPCEIADSSGIRWSLNQFNSQNVDPSTVHFQTPIVLPVGSDLRVVWPGGAALGSRVTLIGRVINL